MFFTPAESRSAHLAFDYYVTSADAALHSPGVIQEIGSDIVGAVSGILENSFLPNRRGDSFYPPRRERDSINVPVISLTETETDRAHRMVQPLLRWFSLEWDANEARRTSNYGLDIGHHLDAMFNKTPGTEEPALGLRPQAMAMTRGVFDISNDRTRYLATRPVVIVRDELRTHSPEVCAAVIAHEMVHARDILTDGPAYCTAPYGVATELGAYHVAASILRNRGGTESPTGQKILWVDQLRNIENGDGPSRHTPTARLQKILVEAGIV